MVTIEQARVGLLWLTDEWDSLRDLPPDDEERETQFTLRLTAWSDWDRDLWINGAYKSCVTGNRACPKDAPLCCSGCVRKRSKVLT